MQSVRAGATLLALVVALGVSHVTAQLPTPTPTPIPARCQPDEVFTNGGCLRRTVTPGASAPFPVTPSCLTLNGTVGVPTPLGCLTPAPMPASTPNVPSMSRTPAPVGPSGRPEMRPAAPAPQLPLLPLVPGHSPTGAVAGRVSLAPAALPRTGAFATTQANGVAAAYLALSVVLVGLLGFPLALLIERHLEVCLPEEP